MSTEKFLSDIQGKDINARFSAWRAAGEEDPGLIPELGRLAMSADPGVAKAAREAIATMVHGVGSDASSPRHAAVAARVLALAGPDSPPPVRMFALRQLSLIAGEDAAPRIATWMRDPDLREEVAFCLERIPGRASNQAFLAAYRDAKDDFKPRILAALGHRRVEEAAPLCAEAMRSTNQEIAVAGAKAFGRIGKKIAPAPKFPDAAGLTEWQKIDTMDSQLRFADAQAKAGNAADAMRIYRAALERPEEHWQCAALVGIAKLGTAEAAAVIFTRLKSANRNVRITAAKAWHSLEARS